MIEGWTKDDRSIIEGSSEYPTRRYTAGTEQPRSYHRGTQVLVLYNIQVCFGDNVLKLYLTYTYVPSLLLQCFPDVELYFS